MAGDVRRSVIAGVDGSDEARSAAHWAAEFAIRHAAPLRCVYGYGVPLLAYTPMGALGDVGKMHEQVRAHGRKVLTDIQQELRQAYPDLIEVWSRLMPGGGAGVLIEESRQALATVVGARGGGGFGHLLLGSVADQVAAYGFGPVVVVREGSAAGPVLVGVDDSQHAARALAFAVAEATTRDADLIVVHTYTEVLRPQTDDPEQEGLDAALRLLAGVVEPHLTAHPPPRIQTQAVYSGRADQAMVDASAGKSLTVVGYRGGGGLTGALLGSTSRALTHHAHSPVAVVH
jgi:nucleotide-binding universal stress UspA family protein